MSYSPQDQTIALASDSEDEIESSIISSDDDSNLSSATFDETKSEEELEARAFSPRTRLSLTGCRPKDLTSDESDIEYEASNSTNQLSDDENGNKEKEEDSPEVQATDSSIETKIKPGRKKTRPIAFLDSEDEGGPADKSLSPIRNRSSLKKENSPMLKQNNSVDGCEYEEKPSFSNQSANESRRVSNSINTSQERRLTFNDDDIKLHSSKIENRFSNNRQKSRFSEDYDVIPESPVTSSRKVINISSDESKSDYSTPEVNASRSDSKRLSRDEIQKEFESLEQLKNELAMCEKLHESVGTKLPDKGKRMLERTYRLKESIKSKAESLSNVTIDDSQNDSNSSVKIVSNTRPKSPTWEELSAGVNEIKPTFTGQIGMAKFTVQKTLTIERLKDIHVSLKSCPTEDVLAEPPKHVKTSLMNHQRHALAWMQWREKQKPRGGILADDMGLGKTLTMISLILKSNEQEETSSQDESLSDEDLSGEEDKGWRSKGRKDFYEGGTLVICPASLANQWENEVKKHTKYNSLAVCVHHGTNRDTKPRRLAKYDMVVTTYNLVGREEKCGGALFGIKWNRIILDEAHVVRNHKTQCSIGVCALRGRCRWALTGTPIQNKVMDVYGLIKFIRCSPFDDLGHWKKWVENKTAGGQERLNTLMKSLMLRRTKAQLQEMGSLDCLPEKIIEVVEVNLHKEEMNVYQKILSFSQSLFAQFLHQRAEKMNDAYYLNQGSRPTYKQMKDPNGAFYKMHKKVTRMFGGSEIKSFQILLLILRLRQICDHPGLIDSMLDDEDTGNAVELDSDEQEIDLLEQLNKLHLDENSSQPNISINDSQEEAIAKSSAKLLSRSNPVFDLQRLSSKMKAVLNILEEKVLSTNDKAIIVSQWTNVLDIFKTHLARKRIIFSELNGKVLIKNRQEIINEFNKPDTPSKILLLSLTAGGVGLNLAGANHLLLIDLHWNPQLEAQAQDRIYRVGQKKPVYIYKFMCKDTIEERIKGLQDHKLAIANGVLTGGKHGEGSKLSIDELKNLFGM